MTPSGFAYNKWFRITGSSLSEERVGSQMWRSRVRFMGLRPGVRVWVSCERVLSRVVRHNYT